MIIPGLLSKETFHSNPFFLSFELPQTSTLYYCMNSDMIVFLLFVQPILLMKFPADVKAFYMQKDAEDPRVVEAVSLFCIVQW